MAILFENYKIGGDTYSTIGVGIFAVGQTFTPRVSHTLTEVRIKVYLFGTRTGSLPISIKRTDGSGHPTGAAVSSGSFADRSTITIDPDGEWIVVSMTSATLSAGIKYVLLPGGSGDGSNAIRWLRDASSPTYSRGDMIAGGTGAWATHTDKDFLFQEWGDSLIPVYPSNNIGRIGSLIHRRDVEANVYSLEMSFGGLAATPPSTASARLSGTLGTETPGAEIIPTCPPDWNLRYTADRGWYCEPPSTPISRPPMDISEGAKKQLTPYTTSKIQCLYRNGYVDINGVPTPKGIAWAQAHPTEEPPECRGL